MCGLEKLGLVDQNWLERNVSVFLLRTLVVGRRQHSESIEVALDMVITYSRVWYNRVRLSILLVVS